MTAPKDRPVILTEEQIKRRRQRNVALAIALFAFAMLFYAVSFIKGPGITLRGP
jgi:hypothetical protein